MPRKRKDGTYMCREMIVKYGPRVKVMGPVTNSTIASDAIREMIQDHTRESTVAVFLNAKNVPLGWRTVGTGGLNTCTLDPRVIIQGAALVGATSVILGHNHPSGDTTPSMEDIKLTALVDSVCGIAGYRFLDHVIVSHSEDYSYSSIRDLGLWPEKKEDN